MNTLFFFPAFAPTAFFMFAWVFFIFLFTATAFAAIVSEIIHF